MWFALKSHGVKHYEFEKNNNAGETNIVAKPYISVAISLIAFNFEVDAP